MVVTSFIRTFGKEWILSRAKVVLMKNTDPLLLFLFKEVQISEIIRKFAPEPKLEQMTEKYKKYRLASTEEPTDEMLQALMEDVAKAARESSAKAEAEKQRRLLSVAEEIESWRNSLAI